MNTISNTMVVKRKTKRKIRWERVMMLAVFLMCCLSLTMNAFADAEPVYVPVTVSQGDTMWDLIREHNPNFTGNMNEAVYETKLLNNTEQGGIYAGSEILIPVFE